MMEIYLRDRVIYICRTPKTMENCAFPQNFKTMNLGEITAFYFMLSPKRIHLTYEVIRSSESTVEISQNWKILNYISQYTMPDLS